MFGVCRGIFEVHHSLPGYSHNDVKSGNFLVTKVIQEEPTLGGGHSGGHSLSRAFRLSSLASSLSKTTSSRFSRKKRNSSSNTDDLADDEMMNIEQGEVQKKVSSSDDDGFKDVDNGVFHDEKDGDDDNDSSYDNEYSFEKVKANHQTFKLQHYVVKIADLEFASKDYTPEHLQFGPHHVFQSEPINWTAPEVLSGVMPTSPSSDIFAIALVLYEIVMRETPFESSSLKSSQVAQYYISGIRPPFDDRWKQFHPGYQNGESNTTNHLPSSSASSSSTMYRSHFELELQSRLQAQRIIESAWVNNPMDRPTSLELLTQVTQLRNSYLRGHDSIVNTKVNTLLHESHQTTQNTTGENKSSSSSPSPRSSSAQLSQRLSHYNSLATTASNTNPRQKSIKAVHQADDTDKDNIISSTISKL
jgi:hypothetical protein